MKHLREAEADAGFLDAGGDAARVEVDRDAERLEEVGAAARARGRAVAVLRDARAEAAGLSGGSAGDNAKIAEAVVDAEPGPARDAVELNAAAALVVAGIATDFAEGLKRAAESIDSGRAKSSLERFREVSQKLKAGG